MAGQYEDKVFDHDFDGIQEYDNPMPSWWLAIFGVSIIWAVFYFAWYQLGPGESPTQRLDREVLAQRTAEAVAALQAGEPSDDAMAALARHPVYAREGAALFESHCATCHGINGEGLIGPNLTDDAWLHGGSAADIYAVVKDGLFDQGCPASSWTMRPDEMFKVTAFVTTLRGLNIPGGRAAEGRVLAGGMRNPAEVARVMARLTPLTTDKAAIAAGAATFQVRCTPCHGMKGEGIIGPNLTDDYWLHGGALADIHHTITNGVVEKGMIPWKTQLSPAEIDQVAVYVTTLHGTNPPNAKPPDGQLWQPEDTTPPGGF